MKKIAAHEMRYQGDKVSSDLEVTNYGDPYFEEYRDIYNDCFRAMRTALGLDPDCCGTREQLLQKRSDIFLLLKDGEMIGSVAIYGNEIDDLIVSGKYQGRGYGKQLLLYAVNYLQSNGKGPISLHVADWNKVAVQLYLNNGFQFVD